MAQKKRGSSNPTYVRIDKRRHPRMSTSLPISFQVISGQAPEKRSTFRQGTIKDVSQGGLCFHTSEIIIDGLHISCDYDEPPFTENTLHIEVALPEPYGPVTVMGQAAWFQKASNLEEEPSYAVGVKFLKFDGHCREDFMDYLRSLD